MFIYASYNVSLFHWSSLYFTFALLWMILTVIHYPHWRLRSIASSHFGVSKFVDA